MTDPEILAELEAAVALIHAHRPASVLLRLSCDRDGNLRLRAEGLDVPLKSLAVAYRETIAGT